jgi:hypothetical protein
VQVERCLRVADKNGRDRGINSVLHGIDGGRREEEG